MEPGVLGRLKRVASRQTVSLTHYGRKTGKPHQVTIWFVVQDDKVYLGTANIDRQWIKNVQKTAQVKLTIGGETFDGMTRFLTDREERERAQRLFARKYWMFSPILGVGRLLVKLGVMRDTAGFFEVTLTG